MNMSATIGADSTSLRKVQQAKRAIALYTVFVAGLLAGAPASLTVPLFPASSLAIAIYLYRSVPALYVGYAWWMIFLSSVLRRIIDYRAGFFTFGSWGLAATLVVMVSSITLIRDLPKLYKKGNLPFLLVIWSTLYGFMISLAQSSIRGVMLGFLGWFAPVAFGYHLYANWQDYPNYRQVMRQTFLWGMIVMGIYGLVQFLVVPPWDKFWLEKAIESGTDSFGQPVPLEVRVSSTMGSPQAFASIMMAGLIFLFSESQNPLYFPATAFGYLSFLLSMARAAWVSWLTALPVLFVVLKPKLQMRLVVTLAVTLLLVIPLTSFEQFSELINSRVQSFSEGQNDVSLSGRIAGYTELLAYAFSTIIGQGYDFSVPVQTDLVIGDGAILPMLFSFGWVGTLPYLSGTMILMVELFKGKQAQRDPLSGVSKAITFGLLSQIAFNHMLVDTIGTTFWGFLGIGLASNQFYKRTKLPSVDDQIIS